MIQCNSKNLFALRFVLTIAQQRSLFNKINLSAEYMMVADMLCTIVVLFVHLLLIIVYY